MRNRRISILALLALLMAAGALFMGLTMGVVAAPCIGPFVLGLLTWVASMGSPWLGFIVFFTLSLGLGLPLFFLAVFSGNLSRLPRSGEWMLWVRKLMGWVSDQLLADSKNAHRPVMIDFSADWRSPCRELDAVTSRHPDVVEQAERHFTLIKVDVTQGGNLVHDRLLKRQ